MAMALRIEESKRQVRRGEAKASWVIWLSRIMSR